MPFDGDLTRFAWGTTRGEQRALRARLFGTSTHRRCALCGQVYPVEFLRAAHIKKRALCNDNERADLDNIAMRACIFGCDALYEAGYLAVDANGTVLAAASDPTEQAADRTDPLHRYLASVAGRSCDAHTPQRATFFAWHRRNVYRG